MAQFDLDLYLNRIKLNSVPATAAGLAALQSAQLQAITFENIDPLLGVEPDVDLPAIFRKVVLQGRGGYCFELNVLLGAALAALGIPARRTLARVRMGRAEGGPRSHLAWIAEVESRHYLVDAGFGGPGALEPLEIDTPQEQQRPNGVYRVRSDSLTGERVVERWMQDSWFPLFGFDEAQVGDADILAANHLCATWSNMPFPHNLMLNGFNGMTRLGVFNRTLTEEASGQSSRRDFADVEDFCITLTGPLGLQLDQPTLESVWQKICHSANTTVAKT